MQSELDDYHDNPTMPAEVYCETSRRDKYAAVGMYFEQLDGGFQVDGPGQFVKYVKASHADAVRKAEARLRNMIIEARDSEIARLRMTLALFFDYFEPDTLPEGEKQYRFNVFVEKAREALKRD